MIFGGSIVCATHSNTVAARYLFAGGSFQAVQVLLTVESFLQASPVQLDCRDGLQQVGADSPKTRAAFTWIADLFIT